MTLLVHAADWLTRHDYYQMTGGWIGREIDARGRLRVNGRIVPTSTPPRARRRRRRL